MNIPNAEEIAECLIEDIYYEGNIQIDKSEVRVEIAEDTVNVTIAGHAFCSYVLEEEDDEEDEEWEWERPEDIALYMIEELGDVKKKLADIRIAQLEEYLPGIIEKVKELLGERETGELDADTLEFEIINAGYFPKMHGMVEEEYVTGYPDIVLEITDKNGNSTDLELNVYDIENSVDPAEVADAVVNEFCS